ncbi:MAG: hypothetical protein ACW981_11695 [Candidatus Hodarchaeales archaeon]
MSKNNTQIVSDKILIINFGSFQTKVGFSLEGSPRLVFLSVVGYEKEENYPIIAEEALYSNDPDIRLVFPFDKSPWHWESVEEILSFIYDEIRIDSSKYPLILILPYNTHSEDKEKIITTFFDIFQVPKLLLLNENDLILHSSYKNTGIVVDIGFNHASIIPYYSGYEISPAKLPFFITAKTFIETLYNSFNREVSFKNNDATTLRNVIELSEAIDGIFYVASNYEREIAKNDIEPKMLSLGNQDYELVSNQFQIPELFFTPSLFDNQHLSLPDTIKSALENCPKDIVKQLCENIILSGAITKIPGMNERLIYALVPHFPIDYLIYVNSHNKREWSAFMGVDYILSKNLLNEFWHLSLSSALKDYCQK